jgi:Phage integrase family
MQIERQEKQPIGGESTAYSLFVYAIRSQVTRDYYLRRLRIFFNHINLLPHEIMEERCNLFAANGLKDPNWAFSCIVKFFQFQRERVEKEEITGATLRNFVKAIKLFCEMSDVPVTWKKISRGLPKIRRYADDRAPTIEEIQKICEYPDRRIKAIVCTMSSCGIRLGAWDYLRWGHIEPIRREGKIIAAKIVVYAGDDEEYFSFVTREAYSHLEKWMEYRKECGENIDDNSWVMRQLWNTKQGHYHHGTIKDAAKLKSSGVKRLIEDALWTQGIRRKSNLKRNRYEFQTDHGFRKWFKTRCEIAGMKSINIEKLMGHSIGISDSYYRVTDNELGKDYLKAIDYLTISNEHKLQMQVSELMEKTKNSDGTFQSALQEKQEKIQILRQRDSMNTDAIANLSDQMMKMAREIEELKKA